VETPFFSPLSHLHRLTSPHSTLGTHPWSQGFPLATQIPGGPPLPENVNVTFEDRLYPKPWGHPDLINCIADYYNSYYRVPNGLKPIEADNIMVFAGGRPALIAMLLFLQDDVKIRVASTEYPAYWDMLERLKKEYEVVGSTVANGFKPTAGDYFNNNNNKEENSAAKRTMAFLSNPCNPTGITRSGEELAEFVRQSEMPGNGAVFDEAYEFFHRDPVSALAFVSDIDSGNVFVTGACTKGLQSPGIRIGWCIASKHHIKVLSNWNGFGIGGCSHLSQKYAVALFEKNRVKQARVAVSAFYESQRQRYGDALRALGLKLWTGTGGFYHWVQLPEGMHAHELNRRLFKRGAGRCGDM